MYCRETGLPFSEEMLSWEPKVFPQWKQYPQYHLWFQSVTHSSGFPPVKLARWSSNQDYRLQLRELCRSMTSFMVSGISLLMHHNSRVVAGCYEEYTSEEFVQFKHTFLIWNLWF